MCKLPIEEVLLGTVQQVSVYHTTLYEEHWRSSMICWWWWLDKLVWLVPEGKELASTVNSMEHTDNDSSTEQVSAVYIELTGNMYFHKSPR